MPKNTLKSTKKSTNVTISNATKKHYKKMKKSKIHPNYRKKYGNDDRIECGIVVKFNKNHGPKWGTIIDAYGSSNDLVLLVQQLEDKRLDEKLEAFAAYEQKVAAYKQKVRKYNVAYAEHNKLLCNLMKGTIPENEGCNFSPPEEPEEPPFPDLIKKHNKNLNHNCLNSRCVLIMKFKPDVYQIYIRDVLTITSFKIAFDICHHNCKRDKCNRCIIMNKLL